MIEIEVILGVVLAVLFVVIFVARKMMDKRKAERMLEQEAIHAAESRLNEAKAAHQEVPQKVATEIKDDVAVETKPQKSVNAEKEPEHYKNLPEDSALRRHYLSHLRAMDETLHGSRPTDSTLKRHYDTMIEKEVEQCLCDTAALEKLECAYQAEKQHALRGKVKKQVTAEVKKAQEANKIPEDSTLRRHYLTHIRSLIEAEHGLPNPTDSTLKRHYETMIDKEVESYLETETN